MNQEAPPVNLNSAFVRKAAEECALSVSDFVELATLLLIQIIRTPGIKTLLFQQMSIVHLLNTSRDTVAGIKMINEMPEFERQQIINNPVYEVICRIGGLTKQQEGK